MEIKLSSLKWTLSWRDPENDECHQMPAQVPGNVVGDLERAGMIQNPLVGCNSLDLRRYEFVDWKYATEFECSETEVEWLLELGGVDTVADILMNGICIGHTENMFIAHTLAIPKNAMKKGTNSLAVCIRSSVNAVRNMALPPSCIAGTYNFEGLALRRPMHTYGWDIAPRIIGAGLWRDGSLKTQKTERWTDVYFTTASIDRHQQATLSLCWNCVLASPVLEGYVAHFRMVCGDSVLERTFDVRFTTGIQFFMDVKGLKLWWPLGSGEQNLYDCTLELLHNGNSIDCLSWRAGIRSVNLVRTETLSEPNPEFRFVVNNETIFIKGSNWVPSTAIHGEEDERMLKSLELFSDLGCNMIRCWGGGIYEDDRFYDRCDELGLLVWQDFMFACETAPQNEAFLEKVRIEAETVVKRLRNHPSVAIYAGDNECDDAYNWYPHLHKQPFSSNIITRRILPEVIRTLDPVRDYLPSSPYHNDATRTIDWNTPSNMPEQHLWGPRDNWKNPFYSQNNAIFASEIGYHGMPDINSIRMFISPAEQNKRHGREWLLHSTQPFADANGPYAYRVQLMEDQTREVFGYLPEDLETFIKCSQIVQAEAMKYLIELFRASKGKRTGLIWWNVIDCWPQFSDAVVDYYYVKKLAYFYIKQAQQPLTMILGEPEGWGIDLTVVNDLMHPEKGSWRLEDLMTGDVIAEGNYSVEANGCEKLEHIRLQGSKRRMLLITWSDSAGNTLRNHHLLGNFPINLSEYLEALGKLDSLIYNSLGRKESFLNP